MVVEVRVCIYALAARRWRQLPPSTCEALSVIQTFAYICTFSVSTVLVLESPWLIQIQAHKSTCYVDLLLWGGLGKLAIGDIICYLLWFGLF